MTITKKHLVYAAIIIFILAIPLIAMQFSNEVHWQINDFVVAAFLLITTVLVVEFITRIVNHKKLKILLLALVVLGLILFWAELAVGIFNSPMAGS